MTIPFLSVKPRAIKLKVSPRFPAQLIGRAGIDVTKDSGNYYLDLDFNDFPIVGSVPAGATYALIFNPTTGQYVQIPISLLGSGSLSPATAVPLVESGAGAVGVSVKYAREDHVHPALGGGGGASVLVSDTPPVGAADNSLWWESDTGGLYIRYNDGNSAQWVTAAASAASAAGAVRYDIAQSLTLTQRGQARANIAAPLRGCLAGLTLSTAGASATFGVTAGEAADSTNVELMQLAAAITKTTAAWAVGSAAGALDTGAIAINTWYHAYVIKRVDTGVVDALISLSATAPTLPTNYTLFRRIGAMRINASSQWIAFAQLGDEFLWATPTLDVNVSNLATVAVLYPLNVPTGVQVLAQVSTVGGSAAVWTYIVTSPDQLDIAPVHNALMTMEGIAGNFAGTCITIRTDTSGRIRARTDIGGGGMNFFASTFGWIDRRGRDA